MPASGGASPHLPDLPTPLTWRTCPGHAHTAPQWLPSPRATDLGHRRLAILASVGEIDPLGTRRDGLDAFLDRKLEEGYEIEARTDTHAIIFRRPKGLKRLTSGADPGRYVVEVDEDGIATMRPAEPRRT
jgi:hypothetical protein